MNERVSKKIVMNPGHGGDDPGTIANGITEKDYTLKISKYLKDRFDDLGIESELTRDSDETLGPKERPLKAQSFFGKGSDVILLSNHINAGGGDGAEIIYALRNNDKLSKMISEEFIKSGQNVRKTFQRRLPSNPAKDYFYILRDTPNNESLIIEYGFADSSGDDPELIKNHWQDLAEAVVRAIARYVKVPYVPIAGSNTYVVKAGDTLWNLARKFDVSVESLKEANHLVGNSLTIGEILIIPTMEEPKENYYVVQSGDSLYKIARQYQMSVADLMKLNNLSSNNLQIGQKLLINPNGETSPLVDTYVVKAGDSLYKIANIYQISVDELKKMNQLINNNLSIGQELKVPALPIQNETIIYTVVAGDNLYQIARRYNISVEELRKANQLISDNLSIGQKLYIPR